MKEELTEKMHSEFSISRESEIQLQVSSAIHFAMTIGVKTKSKFESILENYSVTYDDYKKWKKHYEGFGLKLELEE